jgi:hypothetical protein
MSEQTTLPRTGEFLAEADRYSAHNYKPLPVVVERAEGVWMWDVDGKKYLDMLAAYSALNQGHRHPAILQAAREQMEKVTVTSRAFHNDQMGPFLKELCEATGFDKALPMNTGAEAVETAIKMVRKWGYKQEGRPRGEGRDHRLRKQLPRSHNDDRRVLHGGAVPGWLRTLHARLQGRALRRCQGVRGGHHGEHRGVPG